VITLNFDLTDKRIIDILQDDGRITMKKLADMVHLSAPAAADRVRRLENRGIITGYSARICPKTSDSLFRAFISLSLYDGKEQEFIDSIETTDAVNAAYEIPGKNDVLLSVCCADAEEFLDLTAILRRFGHTDTYLRVKPYKRFKHASSFRSFSS